jgi:asparagine synthase (glutamine-hydrolysing)
MTALAAFWDQTSDGAARHACERMLRSQQVYAPDGPVIWSDSQAALGRRLFKLLPEDRFDRGPVYGGEGTRTLIADIRLDNRAELCSELRIAPDDGRNTSDAALLMRALDQWDEDAVPRLVGDFAFVLWDSRREHLLMARDFLGQRPLHYHCRKNFVAVASMPKGLHALPEVPIHLNEGAVAEFLALVPEGGSTTFFKDVNRVPPSHICVINRAGVSAQSYWNPTRTPLILKSSDDYAEAVREQFDVAVEARLRGAKGRVAAHLSGGLDSSAVTATAARLLAPDGRVTAFTSVPREGYDGKLPRGRFGDEGPHAAALAAQYPNVDHVLIRTNGKSPLADLDRNFFLYERPILNLCNAVWSTAIMDSAKASGNSILLTGQMGNMSFSYTGLELLPTLLADGKLLSLIREAVQLSKSGTRLESVVAHTVGPFLPELVWRTINRWRGRHSKLEDYSAINSRRAAAVRIKAADAGLDFSYRPRRDGFSTRRWVLGRADAGNCNKGQLGGWGVDTRDPTADRRLVELCLRIPESEYLQQGHTRALARRTFADRLPRVILDETRKGLQAVDWHEGLTAAPELAQGELDRIGSASSPRELLNLDKLRGLLEELPSGGWHSNWVQGQYRLALLRGISAGHFARKAEGSNS